MEAHYFCDDNKILKDKGNWYSKKNIHPFNVLYALLTNEKLLLNTFIINTTIIRKVLLFIGRAFNGSVKSPSWINDFKDHNKIIWRYF